MSFSNKNHYDIENALAKFLIFNDEIKIKNCIKKEWWRGSERSALLSNIYQNFYRLIIYFY